MTKQIIRLFYLLFFTTFCLAFNTSSYAFDTICNAPGCAVHKVTSSDGVKLNVNDWGPNQSKKTAILFLHGFPHDGLFWAPQINSLLRLNYRIITMDLRGQGLSDKPMDTNSYSRALLANDIKAVLTALNVKKVILVGHSLGGFPLESYLNEYGINSNGIKVKGVVLVDTTADAQSASYVTPAAEAALGASIVAATPDEFTAASQGFLTLSTLAPLEQGFNDFYLTQDLLTPSAARGVVVTGTLSIANSLNVASAAVKTLIVWGANDAVVDKGAGDYLHSAIPGSQLVVFPNTGHLVQIEKPVAFNLLLYSFANGL